MGLHISPASSLFQKHLLKLELLHCWPLLDWQSGSDQHQGKGVRTGKMQWKLLLALGSGKLVPAGSSKGVLVLRQSTQPPEGPQKCGRHCVLRAGCGNWCRSPRRDKKGLSQERLQWNITAWRIPGGAQLGRAAPRLHFAAQFSAHQVPAYGEFTVVEISRCLGGNGKRKPAILWR